MEAANGELLQVTYPRHPLCILEWEIRGGILDISRNHA
jgi:hypothetical protein